jgi:hypothetical protein
MDLDLTLSSAGEQLLAQAASPLGECHGTSAWPRAEELALDARVLGELLFDRLLPGAVQAHYHRCRGRLAAGGGRLRLRIRALGGAPPEDLVRVHSIPWEVVRDPHSGGFLALDPQVQLVRYLNIAAPVPGALQIGSGEREVLVAAASPAEEARLQWEEEAAAIERAFAGSAVRVTVLGHATRGALQAALRTGRYGVLHYIGHGCGLTDAGLGGIVLEDACGTSDWVSAHELALMTRVTASVGLVFLNACSTVALAPQSHRNLAASVGPALALRGVPAVVGMVREIGDRAAIAFSGGVYARLRDGASLEAAVHAARIAVRLDRIHGESWTIPVVFSRVTAAAPAARREPGDRTAREPDNSVVGEFDEVKAENFDVAAVDRDFGASERPLEGSSHARLHVHNVESKNFSFSADRRRGPGRGGQG